MGYKVILSTLALEDLEQTVAYVAKSDPATAERLGHGLLDQAETLRYLPHRGGNVRQRPGVKKLVSGAYLIFYRVNEPARCVEVLRFWHAAQDPDSLRLR